MRDTTFYSLIESPLGKLIVRGDGRFVTGLFMPQHKGWSGVEAAWQRSDEPFTAVREQLAQYFSRERQEFDVPLKLPGTPFQQQVWQELVQLPFGTTVTYAELARRVGNAKASRAVGNANGRNPVSIIVPCHRVVGADGTLTGYAGGMANKQWLLDWERSKSLAAQGSWLARASS